MKAINLHEIYPDYYNNDYIVEVPDDVFKAIEDADRAEQAYLRRVCYHKAYYSIDVGDGIENEAALVAPTLDDIHNRHLVIEELYKALDKLPQKQAIRIFEHYILRQRTTDIATRSGVSNTAVKASIQRGLRNLKKILKKLE